MNKFKKVQRGIFINKDGNTNKLKRTIKSLQLDNKELKTKLSSLEDKLDLLISLQRDKL